MSRTLFGECHQIDMSNGRANLFVVGEPAWHRLGTNIQEAVNSEEGITLAGLDWDVVQLALRAVLPDGDEMDIGSRVANVRTDTWAELGVVSPGYKVYQNREVFKFMDELTGEKLAMYHTAGALRGGRVVWMLAKLPETYWVGHDAVDSYMLMTNGHDGSLALRIFPCRNRVVCNNTHVAALHEQGSKGLKIRHQGDLSRKIETARNVLGIVRKQNDQFGEEMKALAARKLNGGEVKAYFEGLFPQQTKEQAETASRAVPEVGAGLLDSIVAAQGEHEEVVGDLLAGHFARTESEAKRNRELLDSMLTAFEDPINNLEGTERSAWSAFNAVTQYVDHRPARGRNDATRLDNRLNSMWFGSGADLKQQAYVSALDLLN